MSSIAISATDKKDTSSSYTISDKKEQRSSSLASPTSYGEEQFEPAQKLKQEQETVPERNFLGMPMQASVVSLALSLTILLIGLVSRVLLLC